MFSNNNVVMNIPLVMTAGYISFSSSLMFNLMNENISDFGKGIRWNFYKDFYFMGTGETKIVNSLNEEKIYIISIPLLISGEDRNLKDIYDLYLENINDYLKNKKIV